MNPLQASALPLSILLLIYIRRLRRLPLPPGPPGLPLFGNLFDVATREEWIVYKAVSENKVFSTILAAGSDLVSFNLLGTIVVVVNSFEADQELFEKRSALYSDRPRFTMAKRVTVSPVESFILAMVQNPEIMKPRQAAVDKIIGDERLPEFTDRRSIPCVDAILKETMVNAFQPPLHEGNESLGGTRLRH
uniref:Cytochrome p450 n=1 Tax=Moniliophthora roreri TaxID=221103 RepID=A0A0W0FXJ5_MONRR